MDGEAFLIRGITDGTADESTVQKQSLLEPGTRTADVDATTATAATITSVVAAAATVACV